jgi:hypothetical protein
MTIYIKIIQYFNEHIIQSFAYQQILPQINIFLWCYNFTAFSDTLVGFIKFYS